MGLRAFAARFLRREVVLRDGPYELRQQVVHRGTRSEGRVGRLYHQGQEVHGAREGEVVHGPARRFVFLGHERPHLWSVSGWAEEPLPPAPGELRGR